MGENTPSIDGIDFGRHNPIELPEGVYVSRHVSTRILREYGSGEAFGTDALSSLGVDESLPVAEQLVTLADISDAELQAYAGDSIVIVPHEREQDEEGTINYYAEVVYPSAANQDPEQRLAYVPQAFDYLESKFASFLTLKSGDSSQPEAFHADTALPGQYVVGTTDTNPTERLYFVDLDPEAAPVATQKDGEWELSYILATQVRDLAAVAHQLPRGSAMADVFDVLATQIEATGDVYEGYAAEVSAVLARGYTYEGEESLFEL